MRSTLLLLFTFFLSMVQPNSADPVHWTSEIEKISETESQIHLIGIIDNPWILYAPENDEFGPISFEIEVEENNTVSWNGDFITSEIHEKYDEIFELKTYYFKEKVNLTVPITFSTAGEEKSQLTLYYQVCNEVCMNKEVTFTFDRDGIQQGEPSSQLLTTEDSPLWVPLKNREALVDNTPTRSLWIIFILGMGAGFLALLTPCVFPMIPLTVSFFFNREDSKRKATLLAFVYGFSIVLIYALLSLPFFLIEGLNPNALNSLATNVTLNLFFFVVFVVFSLSFFGWFEITLPNSLINRADTQSNRSGMAGVFFMALTLALVSFSCTGPILGSLLASSLSSSDGALNLSFGMLGFGVALALPFTLLALFPKLTAKMPKSGVWMTDVKVVLGGIELALALKFLSNADLVSHWGLLKRELFIALWLLIALALTLHFLRKLFKNNTKKTGYVLITALLAMVSLYLGNGLITKSPLHLLSGFAPPSFYSFNEQSNFTREITAYHNFDEAREVSLKTGKPMLIDFTGWACVNCRKMEENVWTDPEVYEMLVNKFIVTSLYVDDRSELTSDEMKRLSPEGSKIIQTEGQKWSAFQITNFNTSSQPYYVILSPDLEILERPLQTSTISEYSEWLKSGLKKMSYLGRVSP